MMNDKTVGHGKIGVVEGWFGSGSNAIMQVYDVLLVLVAALAAMA
jgi:hypothetical protein